ncbi:MAG: hypothetical protein KDM64_16860 [Verrucomicrobiae bacterium]|nr:hypothetical protein [Verrucomicrobiae bacterium]
MHPALPAPSTAGIGPICRDGDYAAHLRDCWRNPVKHGLMTRPEHWPRSSAHHDRRFTPCADLTRQGGTLPATAGAGVQEESYPSRAGFFTHYCPSIQGHC